jgi:hypothetical protein
VRAPWAADDGAEARALLAWFRRRYPTPAARAGDAQWARRLAGG